MSDLVDEVERDEWAAFEALGRRAGSALRQAPPEESIAEIERAVRRRTTARIVAGGAAVVMLLCVGLVLLRSTRDGVGPADTTVPSTDGVPSGAPGAWRMLTQPPTALGLATSATWTGQEVIVLGLADPDASSLSALAYDVRSDTWRTLAAPPSTLDVSSAAAWTGTELLVADGHGQVFAYDPITDVWGVDRSAFTTVYWQRDGVPAPSRVIVTPTGVLVRSDGGWSWYDVAADEWSLVPSPDDRFDQSPIEGVASGISFQVLGTDRIVGVDASGTIRFTIFDAVTHAWSPTEEVDGPTPTRGPPVCSTSDGRLICVVEGFGSLQGVVIDVESRRTTDFGLGSHDNEMATLGTPWWGHAWALLSPRTGEWEELPPLLGVGGFPVAAWDGKELLMFGGTSAGGRPTATFAAAYTPKERP